MISSRIFTYAWIQTKCDRNCMWTFSPYELPLKGMFGGNNGTTSTMDSEAWAKWQNASRGAAGQKLVAIFIIALPTC